MVSECQKEELKTRWADCWVCLVDDDKASDRAVDDEERSVQVIKWEGATSRCLGGKEEGVRGPTHKAARRQNIPVVAETSGYSTYSRNASRQGGGKIDSRGS